MATDERPMLTIAALLWCQVCVPEDWTPEQIVAFAEREYPCGTTNGWHLVEEADGILPEGEAVVPCAERPGFVHRVLTA